MKDSDVLFLAHLTNARYGSIIPRHCTVGRRV